MWGGREGGREGGRDSRCKNMNVTHLHNHEDMHAHTSGVIIMLMSLVLS